VLQWNVAATYSSARGGRRGGVFIERIAQAVCLGNRLCKSFNTGGSHKKTACVNAPFTQAVSLCEPPVQIH